jgi:hypothetical protein
MTGGKAPKKTTVPSSKRTGDSTPAKKVTVSQATIDQIKSQGMAAALKKAAAGGVSASYMEGVKRMYGAARVAKATSANINAASKPKAYGANNAPKYRPATAATTKAATKPTSSKPAPKPKPTRDSGLAQVTRGVKRVVNSSPGANLNKLFSNKSQTAAQKEAARKASAAAVKRAGGRTM